MEFCGIVQSAVDGTYWDQNAGFFAKDGNGSAHNKLRAHIHQLNDDFSNFMRIGSQKRTISCAPNPERLDEDSAKMKVEMRCEV